MQILIYPSFIHHITFSLIIHLYPLLLECFSSFLISKILNINFSLTVEIFQIFFPKSYKKFFRQKLDKRENPMKISQK